MKPKNIFSILTIIIFFLATISFFSACRNFSLKDNTASTNSENGSMDTNAIEDSSQTIGVAASIIPIGEFIKEIGSERVEVTVMVPSGVDPHVFEPSPKQLMALDKALMYVKLGSGFDFELGLMNKIAEINRNMIIVDSSDGIKTLDDPHIWLSLKNAKIIAENICRGLIKVDPENKSIYERNKDIFTKKLEELDEEIFKILKDKKNRKFMVYHPAWTYFARDYNLEQISIEYEGKEPSAKTIETLILEAQKNGIKVIFASPQFSTKSADVIAAEIGGKVVLIDPLKSGYMENMKAVAEILADYME